MTIDHILAGLYVFSLAAFLGCYRGRYSAVASPGLLAAGKPRAYGLRPD